MGLLLTHQQGIVRISHIDPESGNKNVALYVSFQPDFWPKTQNRSITSEPNTGDGLLTYASS